MSNFVIHPRTGKGLVDAVAHSGIKNPTRIELNKTTIKALEKDPGPNNFIDWVTKISTREGGLYGYIFGAEIRVNASLPDWQGKAQ